MCLYIEIGIKYAFFAVLKQIGFPLGGDQFGGMSLCSVLWILVTTPFLPVFVMAGGDES